MDVVNTLLSARRAAGLTQARLAALGGTSQATVSAYESGRKAPTLATLERLLAATGTRLCADAARHRARELGPGDHARTARVLADVLDLAAELPTAHAASLDYPRLPT